MPQTNSEAPGTQPCQQENRKPEAAVRAFTGFPFPEALRRHHGLRRSVSRTVSNEEKEFRFLGASGLRRPPPNRAKTTIPRSHRASWAGLNSGSRRRYTEIVEGSRIPWSVRRLAGSEPGTTFPSVPRAREGVSGTRGGWGVAAVAAAASGAGKLGREGTHGLFAGLSLSLLASGDRKPAGCELRCGGTLGAWPAAGQLCEGCGREPGCSS